MHRSLTPPTLRPILRPVKNPRDFDRVFLDLINSDVRQRRKRQFSPSVHPVADSSHGGKISQLATTVVDDLRHASCGFWVVAFDPGANAFEVLGCRHGPKDLHQGCRKRRSRSPTCSWVRNSPRSKAASPRFTASTKRSSSSK